MANANGLDPGLRSNYPSYAQFNPTTKVSSIPYGTVGNPGGIGWIAPEVNRSSTGGTFLPSTNSLIDSNFYNKFPTNTGNNTILGTGKPENNPFGAPKLPETKAFRGSNSSNFGDMSLPPDPNSPGGGAGSTASGNATPEAMRSLSNRKPVLGTAWGGWSNNMQTNSTPGNNNFTFYSKFA